MTQSTTSWIAAVGIALAISACIPDAPTEPIAPAPASANSATGTTSAITARGSDIDPGDNSAPPDSKSLLKEVESRKDQLKNKPKDVNIDSALGNLFYDNGRYIDSIEFYTDGLDRAAPTEKRILAAGPSGKHAVPATCLMDHPTDEDKKRESPTRTFESIVAAASSMDSSDPEGALACLRQLAPSLATMHARRGNSWYLVGNPDKARADHRAALLLNPDDPEALFFSGALELETSRGDKTKIAEGKAFWEKLLKVAPDHPRAQLVKETLPRVEELFGKPPADAPKEQAASASAPTLPPGMMEAMQNVQHTPEMDAQLDSATEQGEEFLKQGKWMEALASFKQVMPLRPSGRIALDLGIALREMGKPTAERVLTQATKMPGGDAQRARFELAIYYEKANPEQAKAIYQDLLTDSRFGADAKARLAKL